ncbi:hypothetical protein LTS18_008044, partial [Coniosporium uncinatum]
TQHRDNISATILRLGFNSVRLPYADEMVIDNPTIPAELLTANPDLIGSKALDVYVAVAKSLIAQGVAVIPNNHITQATWCCGANLCDTAWSNEWVGPLCRVRQTEEEWIQHWETITSLLADEPLVIGMDLRNEVRGPWGTMSWDRWATATEKASERILKINKDLLIIVEGISSANDVSGARKRPVSLSVQDRVVYSAHVYAWSGWGALAPYSGRMYESFARDMRYNWAYLLSENIAPVWVGEFGTTERPSAGDLNYWKHLMKFLDEEAKGVSWGYWAINPRKLKQNEWEGYGLLRDDWETVRWDYRTRDLGRVGLGK